MYNEWIQHDGIGPPIGIDINTPVDIFMRCGKIQLSEESTNSYLTIASYQWQHNEDSNSSGDITAFRISKVAFLDWKPNPGICPKELEETKVIVKNGQRGTRQAKIWDWTITNSGYCIKEYVVAPPTQMELNYDRDWW